MQQLYQMDKKIVYVRSRREDSGRLGNPALGVSVFGDVMCRRFGEARFNEQFKLHIVVADNSMTIIALQACNGNYLSSRSDGKVSLSFANSIEDRQMWQIEQAVHHRCSDDQRYILTIKSVASRRYLSCYNLTSEGWSLTANSVCARIWEQFYIVDNPHAMTGFVHTERAAESGLKISGSIWTADSVMTPLMGFAGPLVASGSAAAAIQSSFYEGTTSGFFSVLHSAGATFAWFPYTLTRTPAEPSAAEIMAAERNVPFRLNWKQFTATYTPYWWLL